MKLTAMVLLLLAVGAAGCGSSSSGVGKGSDTEEVQSPAAMADAASDEPSCSTPSTASERGSESVATPTFDPDMSKVCEQACAAKLAYREEDVVRQPGARTGDLTQCPVSGVVFVVQEDNARVAHEGQERYLCCDGCSKKFRKNPARFMRS